MTRYVAIRRIPLTVFTIIFSLVLLQQNIFAQAQNAASERGYSPGKSYSVSDIETIGLYSGNMMVNLPLGSLPAGRGGISAGINLHYDSKLWDMLVLDVTRFTTTHDAKFLDASEEGGWDYNYKYHLKLDHRRFGLGQGGCEYGNESSYYTHKLQLVLPDGSRRQMIPGNMGSLGEDEYMNIFPDGRLFCNPVYVAPGQIVSFYSTDGTFLRLEIITDTDQDWENNIWTLYMPDGSKVIHNPNSVNTQKIQDRNGNFIDVIETAADANYSNNRTTYLQDQMNRKVVIEYNAAADAQAGWTEDYIHSKGFGGADIITRVRWKTIIVNKIYWACEMAPAPFDQHYYETYPLNQSFRVVDKVFLPTQVSGNLFYEFGYNADQTTNADVGWGEINQIKLPSGAVSSYEYFYDNVTGGLTTAEMIMLNRPMKKHLTYNKEYDGTAQSVTDTWIYTPTMFNNLLEKLEAVTVTAPDGGATTEHYAQDGGSTSPPEYVKGEVYKTEAADGTVIEKVRRSTFPGGFGKINRYVKYEFVSIKDAAGNLTKTAINEYSQDKNGNGIEVKTYDYIAYSSVPRNSLGRVYVLPSGMTPARISKTDYYNDTPEASSTNITDTDIYSLPGSPRLLRLTKAVEVQNGAGAPQTRSELFYDYTTYATNTTGGNPTQTKSWDSYKNGASQAYSNPLTATNSVSTAATYDGYGNPVSTTDAKGVTNTITYGSINGYSGLYPTQTETAANYSSLKRTSTINYDFYTGLATTATDVDNNLTGGTEYDALGRPTKAKTAVGTASEVWTQTEYDDVNRRVVVKSDLFVKGDGKKIGIQHYDQLGRVRLSRSIENAATENPYNEADGIKVQTRYQTGNPYSYSVSSNPYRAATSGAAVNEPSMGWTRSKTINTGNHSEVETFSGAALPAPWGTNAGSSGVVTTDTDAERTLVTDQAGKQRISKTNALGQLTNVWEVKAADSNTEGITFGSLSLNGMKTSYSYDILNNLTTVNQGVQTRSFSYSSLSRLKSATNPESGAISYVYDENGNLTGKTDARNITTSYVYDALNRVTARNYNDNITPNVTYTYDDPAIARSKGKLTKVENSVSKTEYQVFDELGRVTQSQQTTGGAAYGTPMTYTYNLSGALVEQKYPSGRVVKNTLDANGMLQQVESKKANDTFRNYANSFNYTAAGAVSSMRLGNGKWENTVFNSRLQPTQIGLGSSATNQNLLKLNFDYGGVDNNGNVKSQTIIVPTETRNNVTYSGFTAVQTYSYDELNRLKSAVENQNSVQNWKQTFLYDRYGNRNFDVSQTTTIPAGCAAAVCNPTVDTATNRLVGYTFDNAGNTKIDAQGRQFTYDGENKQTLVKDAYNLTIGQYYYDGDGKRVKKFIYSTQETTIFVYDASGKMVAEYSTTVAPVQDAKISYLTSDHLGSPRINTDATGQVTARHDYMPFGEEIYSPQRTQGLGYVADNIRQKFTSYERDIESDLDFAQARYYKSGYGRFTSTDPIMLNLARMKNPQVFNAYSYTANNPLRFTDPNGEDLVAADEEQAKNIKKLAPGSKIDANGNVKKPSFFRRVWNRVTGHGDGTKLISQLVDSKKVTTAATLKGMSGAKTINIDAEKTDSSSVLVGGISDYFKSQLAAQGTTVRDDTNYLIVIGTDSENVRMPDGSIQLETTDSAITLGHELIHASHLADGSFVADKGEHNFSENGVNYVERPSPAGREELRTSGLAYNKRGDITENSLRKELGYRPRATYLRREKWELRK